MLKNNNNNKNGKRRERGGLHNMQPFKFFLHRGKRMFALTRVKKETKEKKRRKKETNKEKKKTPTKEVGPVQNENVTEKKNKPRIFVVKNKGTLDIFGCTY